MIENDRKIFNQHFSETKYQEMLRKLYSKFNHVIPFRVGETPVFISDDFKNHLYKACDEILEVICKPDYKELVKNAIPDGLTVPGEDDHTNFLAIDFAVCKNDKGEIIPQLIELQGFPSLYAYQVFLGEVFKGEYPFLESKQFLQPGVTVDEYIKTLKEVVLDGNDPRNVILLEIEPEKQNTYIDFLCTEFLIGIKTVCISKVLREGNKLFYEFEGEKIQINRIYNRVIFDELQMRDDLPRVFDFSDNLEITWAGHPNWFFKISKYTMPFLKSIYVPESSFVNQLAEIPLDLENYVLKPLYSFSGAGVKFHVLRSDITELTSPENYILQRKVNYEPIIQAPDGMVKAEVRMLFLWSKNDSKPKMMANLARLSRGEMIGVKFNKDKTWVGGTICMF